MTSTCLRVPKFNQGVWYEESGVLTSRPLNKMAPVDSDTSIKPEATTALWDSYTDTYQSINCETDSNLLMSFPNWTLANFHTDNILAPLCCVLCECHRWATCLYSQAYLVHGFSTAPDSLPTPHKKNTMP